MLSSGFRSSLLEGLPALGLQVSARSCATPQSSSGHIEDLSYILQG